MLILVGLGLSVFSASLFWIIYNYESQKTAVGVRSAAVPPETNG